MADLALLAARFAAAVRDAGVSVGPERTARFARAVTLVDPTSTGELYSCALATLVSDPADIEVLDRVFAMVFAGLTDVASWRGAEPSPEPGQTGGATGPTSAAPGGVASGQSTGDGGQRLVEAPQRFVASAAEQLSTRDFATLDPDELAMLAGLMRQLRLATPLRRSRRLTADPRGHLVDLRSSLRQARRTGGYPVRLRRKRHTLRPRRLVVLCDISGSMEPYARAMLQLLYCAAGGKGSRRAEVFTFATRLTRLTRVLARSTPDVALRAAGQAAPDWSGGTRIGAAVKEFLDGYGARGMARGAVVLIISDGWETGDPAVLGVQLARLSRLAYRIVWANPRTASPRYEPLVGGMAAAWPYCDAVVSAHRLTALDELAAAIATP